MTRRSRAMAALIAAVVLAGPLSRPAAAADEAAPAAPTYLYRATFVRAAPGKLLELIGLYKDRMAFYDSAGDERPLWWRHAEGDQWDLMLIYPLGSYTDYYSAGRLARRAKAAGEQAHSPMEFERRVEACIAWREDLFVLGPPVEKVKKEFEAASFYHIEMFVSLPGKQADLLREREMENAYQEALGRPAYLNFIRDQGAAWDVFSLGCYRDMLHWADTANIPKDKKDEAASRAGFKDSGDIGPTMRTLILMHRDTMGGAVR
jgi:hypothetical protein